jgi:hypothetical protein
MNKNLTAKASVVIEAPISVVWDALTKPELIKRYMFGTNVVADWQVGSPIVCKGEWQGKTYEDKGKSSESTKNAGSHTVTSVRYRASPMNRETTIR